MNFGPYEVIRELGRGGMGVVYLARHAELDREFALKTLQAGELGTDGADAHPELVARFVREGRAAARLAEDPGAVAVHDVGTHNGIPYLAMDFVPGGDLRELIEAGDYDLDTGLRLVEQVARSVHRAHQAGVLHRDLKPENILIDAEGNPRVTDYGLAKLQELDAESRKLTRTGALMGTVGYMAPEQLAGEAADARSDVHALGVCLYEVVTGQAPYEGDSVATVLNHVMRLPPRSPRMPGLGVSRDLEAIILKSLEKDPRARFQSAEDLADEIGRVRAGAETLTRPTGVAQRALRSVAGSRPAMLLVFTALAGAGFGAWWTLAGADEEVKRDEVLKTTTAEAEASDRDRRYDAAYLALLQAVREDLLLLEDGFRGNARAKEGAAEAVQRVRDAAGEMTTRFGGAPAPTALALLAERYAGRSEASDEIAALANKYPSDPFPRLIHAQARWSEYSEYLQMPGLRIGISGVLTQDFVEGPRAEEMRARVERTLEQSDLFTGLPPELEPWKQWGVAARLLGEGKLAEAEQAFAQLGDEPLLAHGALMLRGVAIMLQGRDAEAAPILERAGERGWVKPLKLAGAARLSEALGLGAGTSGSAEALARARINYEAALELDPADVETRLNLAVTQSASVVAGFEPANDPNGRFRAGLATLTAVVKEHPERVDARRLRGGVYLYLARMAQDGGRDPRDLYRAALRDLEAAIATQGDAWSAYGLGLVHYELARADAMAQVDPSPGYARALQALEAGIRDASVRSDILGVRALVRLAQAEMEVSLQRDGSALLTQAEQDFDRAIELAPDSPTPLRLRASCAGQLANIIEFTGGDPLPVYERAIADLTKALAMLPGNAQIHVNRGSNRMILGDAFSDARKPGAAASYEAAVADFRAAIETTPKDWQALANLAMALGRLGRWKEAVAPAESAVRLVPAHPQLVDLLAQARRRAGK